MMVQSNDIEGIQVKISAPGPKISIGIQEPKKIIALALSVGGQNLE